MEGIPAEFWTPPINGRNISRILDTLDERKISERVSETLVESEEY
jgi:hypothetical protein